MTFVVDIGSNIRLFADDTSLYMVVDNPDTAAELLNLDINKIMTLAKKLLVTFNPVKTESLLISRKLNRHTHPPVFMENQQSSKLILINILVFAFPMTVHGMSILILLKRRPGKE